MRRRLYFVLPDVEAARGMCDELLLARVEERHMHFLARRGTLPPDLPEATLFQKTDIVHGAEMGVVIGGIAGIVAGAVAMMYPPEGVSLELVTIVLASLAGALFGAWVASLAATAVPNTRLKVFEHDIEAGRVLLMVDVPFRRVRAITGLVTRRHPEAVARGVEPTIPAFP